MKIFVMKTKVTKNCLGVW